MRNLYLFAHQFWPMFIAGSLAAAAQPNSQSSPLTGQLVKSVPAKTGQIKVPSTVDKQTNQTTKVTIKPKYHIEFNNAQSNKNDKPFQTIQASLPDKAIKIYLHRIKAEPNNFAGLLPNPGETNTAASDVPSVSGKSSTAFDTGSQPRVMSASGVAIPQTTGASSGFFK